ncbi:MAG: glutamine amidotransferase family protein [Atribacterota bacterium]
MRERERIPSGCAVAGILSQSKSPVGGETIIQAMRVMHERSNGLGGGFAGYGIYPDFASLYVFHVLYDCGERADDVEMTLCKNFVVEQKEAIPTWEHSPLKNHPKFMRYFLRSRTPGDEEELVVRTVMEINARIDGAYVVSSGKNMGVFKGVGYPEEIGEFFRLDEYQGYCWIAHGRFPTNSVGWWGGAHPFNLLHFSVVHNGELSSYGINRRYLENFGYFCTLQTDTEVIAYLLDLLLRRHRVPPEALGAIFASPFWSQIEAMEEPERSFYQAIRITYGGALLNGPFSIIVGFEGGMLGLVDRIKLRPMVAAWNGDMFYLASEESAIREIAPELDTVCALRAGEVVVGKVRQGVYHGQELTPSQI